MEHEKKLRREIANSNERRRMQSINAGFQSLRNLLPQNEGEKLSKAAILQQTADYIYELDREKTKLAAQNAQMRKMLAATGTSIVVEPSVNPAPVVINSSSGNNSAKVYKTAPIKSHASEIPPSVIKRRKTMDGAVESGDEGIGNMSPDHSGSGEESRSEVNDLRRATMDLRLQLDRERRHRVALEQHITLMKHEQEIYAAKMEKERSVDEVDSYILPSGIIHDKTPRCYTIRNNLETIVEAIRHLEGDHLFSDDRNNSESELSNSSPALSPTTSRINETPHSPQPQLRIVREVEEEEEEVKVEHEVEIGLEEEEEGEEGEQSTLKTKTLIPFKDYVLNRMKEVSGEEPINLEFRSSPPVHTTKYENGDGQVIYERKNGEIFVGTFY